MATKSEHCHPKSAPVLAAAIYQLLALTESATFMQIFLSKHCQATSFTGLDVATSDASQPYAVDDCVALINSCQL